MFRGPSHSALQGSSERGVPLIMRLRFPVISVSTLRIKISILLDFSARVTLFICCFVNSKIENKTQRLEPSEHPVNFPMRRNFSRSPLGLTAKLGLLGVPQGTQGSRLLIED